MKISELMVAWTEDCTVSRYDMMVIIQYDTIWNKPNLLNNTV